MNNHNTISEDEHFGPSCVFNCEIISIRSSIDTYIFFVFYTVRSFVRFLFYFKNIVEVLNHFTLLIILGDNTSKGKINIPK